MTKTLYIIRHGQTEYNKMGKVQGSGIDAPLNDEGHHQARLFYERHAHIPFDKIYVSALQRTHQSVALFAANGIDMEILAELNEISWGIKEGEQVNLDDHTYYAQVVRAWRSGDLEKAIEGGESPLDVVKRQQKAINHIMSRAQEQNVLICMHGRAMRILLSQLLNTPLEEMDQYEHSNLCLYRLGWDGVQFDLLEANRSVIQGV